MSQGVDPRVRWFFEHRFCLREGASPEQGRASGDSGFVAHLTAMTHGATGWDWSFKLVKPGPTWVFVSDGRLSLFLDEPGQYVPADARLHDAVAVRMPRARENLYPHRFTLHGGQGGPVVGSSGFTKFFLPVTYEAAPRLVEACAGRLADQLRFGLCVANHGNDFARADAAMVDVGPSDEAGVVKLLEAFVKANPDALARRGRPFGTAEGPLGLAKTHGATRADLADGYGWRRAHEAAAAPG